MGAPATKEEVASPRAGGVGAPATKEEVASHVARERRDESVLARATCVTSGEASRVCRCEECPRVGERA